MKNKILKVFIVILCIFSIISVANFATINNVKADSGWDSDYDSGGSDWGGGSDFGSDSDSSSSLGRHIIETPIDFIFSFGPFFVIIIVCIIIGIKNSKANRLRFMLPQRLSDDQIHQVDPSLNIEEFKAKVYMIYLDIQYAWMNFNYDRLRELTTDELYNMYSMQLDTLSIKGEKNVMKDFIVTDSYISNIYIQNNIETVEFILKVAFYDYVVNSNNVIVRGTDEQKLELTYKLTLVKVVGPNDNNYCPNCGAKLEDKASTVCPYCNSVIVSDNYTWVMSKKESLGQRRI